MSPICGGLYEGLFVGKQYLFEVQAPPTSPAWGVLAGCSVITKVGQTECDSFLFFLNVYSFFERQSMSGGEGQRERETQSRKQAPGSELSAQSLMGAQTHRLRDHDLS